MKVDLNSLLAKPGASFAVKPEHDDERLARIEQAKTDLRHKRNVEWVRIGAGIAVVAITLVVCLVGVAAGDEDARKLLFATLTGALGYVLGGKKATPD